MIKLRRLITEATKRTIKWIRWVQITNAEPDVIRHDHIDNTFKAIADVDKKAAAKFKKIADKYKKQRETYEKEYNQYKDKVSPTEATKRFYDGVSKYSDIGKQLINFVKKSIEHDK